MFYTCTCRCAGERYGYGPATPRAARNAICLRGGLRESRCCARIFRTARRGSARGGWKFFRRPLEDQAPFIKCSLEGEGVGVAERRERCQNFQQFFIPLFARPKQAGVRLDLRRRLRPARLLCDACARARARSRRCARSSNKWDGGADARVLFNSGPSGVNKCRRMMYCAAARRNKVCRYSRRLLAASAARVRVWPSRSTKSHYIERDPYKPLAVLLEAIYDLRYTSFAILEHRLFAGIYNCVDWDAYKVWDIHLI